MGHHLTKEGRWRSDKYLWCLEGFFVLKIATDPLAQTAALIWAERTADRLGAADVRAAVMRYRAPVDPLKPAARWRSAKYNWCLDGFLPLNIATESAAQHAALVYADLVEVSDPELAADLRTAVANYRRRQARQRRAG